MAESKPTEQEVAIEKKRLIAKVIPELKDHGLVDLTAFVEKHSASDYKHSGFVRSLAYRIEEMGLAEVIPKKEWSEFYIKRNIYSKRHPILFTIILASIGIFFSILAGAVNAYISKRINTVSTNEEIKKQLIPLNTQQTELLDSIKKISSDLRKIKDTQNK